MFAYCGNNPTSHTDPTGHASWGTNTVAISDCKSGLTPGIATYLLTIMESEQRNTPVKESVVGILDAINTPSNDGRTFSVALTGSTIFGNSGAGKSYSLSVASGNHYALQTTETFSVASGMGASVGLALTLTNAKYVSDLNGRSDAVGFTAVGLMGISIDYLTFVPASEPSTTKHGICVSILWGADTDIHAGTSYTQTQRYYNPISWLIEKINGGV